MAAPSQPDLHGQGVGFSIRGGKKRPAARAPGVAGMVSARMEPDVVLIALPDFVDVAIAHVSPAHVYALARSKEI